MKQKYIIIIIIIIVIVLFFYNKSEHLDTTSISNEAIQNIASVYADSKQTATFNNIKSIGGGTFNNIKTTEIVSGKIKSNNEQYILEIQDNGNLMIQDKDNKILWQSISFTPDSYKTTGLNENGNGNSAFLDRHNIDCGDKGLNRMQLRNKGNKMSYDYTCLYGGNLGQSQIKSTQLDNGSNGNTIFLDRHNIDCGNNAVLSQLKLNIVGVDQKYKYDYTCKAGTNLKCRQLNTEYDSDGGGNSSFLDRHNIQCNPNEALSRLQLVRDATDKYRYDYTCCSV